MQNMADHARSCNGMFFNDFDQKLDAVPPLQVFFLTKLFSNGPTRISPKRSAWATGITVIVSAKPGAIREEPGAK